MSGRSGKPSQFSSPSRSLVRKLTYPLCRRFLFGGIVFFAGVLLGLLYADRHLHFKRFNALLEQSMAAAKGESAAKKLDRLVTKNVSIAWMKDYNVRNVFIDISTGPPRSLELFLETYPQAHQYTVYTFLADSSYELLYSKFSNLTLYSRIVLPSTKRLSAKELGHKDKKPSKIQNMSLPTLALSNWVKDNVHPDEHVIIKMTTDSELEEDIARDLVATGMLGWFDKYYTSSSNSSLVKSLQKLFSTPKKLFLWDDAHYTYQDFDELNPPQSSNSKGETLEQCQGIGKANFTLLLYFSQQNKHASATLSLLHKMSRKRSAVLPLTLFFPFEYLDFYSTPRHSVKFLGKQMELGLYLHDFSFPGIKSNDPKTHENRIRNKLVSVEHLFQQANITLNYILLKSSIHKTDSDNLASGCKIDSAVELSALKNIIRDRKYIEIGSVHDVTPDPGEKTIDLSNILQGTGSGKVIAMDVSTEGMDAMVMQLLNLHTPSLVPLHKCLEPQI